MKKLLQKINTRGTRSVVFGLVLTLLLGAGTSMVKAQGLNPTVAVDFLGPTSSLVSRIGSLTIGNSTTASWITDLGPANQSCTHTNQIGDKTCLDVNGGGTFSNLIIDQATHIVETVTVSTVGEYAGGPGRGVGTISPTFLIEDDPWSIDDSMRIQGLGRINGGQNFNPIDTTTEREVCAKQTGELRIC